MALEVRKESVWVAELEDRSGSLAGKLEALAEAGANLESVIARRQPDKPGSGAVFVAPVKGRRVQNAAKSAGFMQAKDITTLRIEGPDEPGLGARLLRTIADQGINMRGVSAVVHGRNFAVYIGFDSLDDANRAMRAIRAMDRARVRNNAPKRNNSANNAKKKTARR